MTENDTLYWINGVKIIFPLKAYGSQISIMSSVTRAIKQSKNCLIESPTGTGKTLALLCSSLAWVEANNNNIYKEKVENAIINNKPNILEKENSEDIFIEDSPKECCDFISPPAPDIPSTEKNNVAVELDTKSPYFIEGDPIKKDTKKPENLKTAEPAAARSVIYYCTRTHYQISQVVSELKRTKYCNANIKMAILSSRKLSCIDQEVRKAPSISDACKARISRSLQPEERCNFYNHVFMMDNHQKLRRLGIKGAWDIEDFIEVGKYNNACPYFSSQKLMETADIVFAPYNYILNPLIAKQMNISLRNNVLIFDEAHNIEDVCRSAMSAVVTHEQFLACYLELNRIREHISDEHDFKAIRESYYHLSAFSSSLANWIKDFEKDLEVVEFDKQQTVLNGTDVKSRLNDDLKVDSLFIEQMSKYYFNLVQSYTVDEYEFLPKASEAAQSLLSSILMIFEHLVDSSADQFVVSIEKGIISETDSANSQFLLNTAVESTSKLEDHNSSKSNAKQLTISFICLSPSLTFKTIQSARSVILASGTLSPMTSFSPELGCAFDICFQASNHLMPNQAAVYSLSVDSKNNPLRITYKNIDSFNLQDELGLIIYEICEIVPCGVLCFLPSYTLLEKLISRWKKTHLYKKLEKIKNIFVEVKGMSASDAEKFITDYYKSIFTKDINGSILFAVCRGRISEGVDFSDEKARAVIAIGIPYPNIKVVDIERKMLFNDNQRKGSANAITILSGRQWYNIQAYRALNQALGRCIRHKNDWGAIILIDERFDNNSSDNDGFMSISSNSNNYLSSWVRNNLHSYINFMDLKASLSAYISQKPPDIKKANPKQKPRIRKFTPENTNLKKPKNLKKYIKDYFVKTPSEELDKLEDFILNRNED